MLALLMRETDESISKKSTFMDMETNNQQLQEKRERYFIALASIFICCMTLLNVVGITRFIELGPLILAVGVLPYPLTFLCTDLISEFYGRKRANFLVSVGLILNLFIIGFMWLAQAVPAAPSDKQPPWQVIQLAENIALPNGNTVSDHVELFQLIYQCSAGAVFASMLAYIAAQYADVRLFHFFKRLTQGRHRWLRNNLSTLVSQGIDSITVISVTFGAILLAGGMSFKAFCVLVGSNYLFKLCVALIDTLPFYWLSHHLEKQLQIDPKSLR